MELTSFSHFSKTYSYNHKSEPFNYKKKKGHVTERTSTSIESEDNAYRFCFQWVASILVNKAVINGFNNDKSPTRPRGRQVDDLLVPLNPLIARDNALFNLLIAFEAGESFPS